MSRIVFAGIVIIASLFLAVEMAAAEILLESVILFLSDRDGDAEIYVFTDGKVKQLTRNGNIDKDPTWSPDGTQITWMSNKLRGGPGFDVWVMEADGKNQHAIVEDAGDGIRRPRWSPDGTKIAFVANAGAQNWYIFFVDFTRLEGKGKKQKPLIYDVTGTGRFPRQEADRDPVFSPDGTLLAFESNRDKNAEIYVADITGEPGAKGKKVPGDIQQRLAADRAQDRRPRWSPDGQHLTFQSDRTGDWQLYSINPKGENLQQLTDNGLNWRAEWSPNAKQIAFESKRDKNPEIYVMNADGTNQVNLTNHPTHDTSPQWSPSGRKILFHSRRDGNREVYVMDADGQNPVNVSNDPGGDWEARWQPLGRGFPVEPLGQRLTRWGQIKQTALLQNYPNPFNPETWIPYILSEDSPVTISIYNVSGKLVRTLALGHKTRGIYVDQPKAAYWDGHNDAGEAVGSGAYFYQLRAGDFIVTRKMVVAK